MYLLIVSEIVLSTVFNMHNVQIDQIRTVNMKRKKGNMLNLNEILVVKLDMCAGSYHQVRRAFPGDYDAQMIQSLEHRH